MLRTKRATSYPITTGSPSPSPGRGHCKKKMLTTVPEAGVVVVTPWLNLGTFFQAGAFVLGAYVLMTLSFLCFSLAPSHFAASINSFGVFRWDPSPSN